MKKLALLLSVFLLLSLPALAEDVQAVEAVDPADEQELAGYIILLHTGNILGKSEGAMDFSRIAEAKTRFEDSGAAVLLLDAGNAFGEADEAQEDAVIAAMAEAGYDAMTPGGEELARGLDWLTALNGRLGFPLLSANLQDEEGGRLLSGSIIVEKDGLRMGIFGLSGETEEIPLADAAKSAQSAVSTLRGEGCDVVIALAYLGADEKGAAAVSLAGQAEGIDIIIDISAGAPADGLWTEDETLIVSGGEALETIGIVAIDPTGHCAAMEMDESWF